MKNVEIVKQVLADVAYLSALGDATLSEYSNETQAEILTQSMFVRLSVLDALKSDICAMGANIADILVCPMPMMDNRLSIIIVFKTNAR
jgi:hypothetical protein